MSEEINLKDPALYINRELSAIEFNRRVLYESRADHPLLEQVKFIAIFTSNMDEFFMVRVSGLKQQVLLGINKPPADGLTPREQLFAIHDTMTNLFQEATDIWLDNLVPQLFEAGIRIVNFDSLKSRQQSKLSDYFEREIYPVLTPLAFDPGRPFPHISNLSLNLAIEIRDPERDVTNFARVKVPPSLPRLVPLRRHAPDELLPPSVQRFVWVEQVIQANLDRLFPGMEIVSAYPFRITRNNDMEIQEEEADDLLLTMEENLRQRHFGSVVRLEIDEGTPEHIRELLIANLEINPYDVYTTRGPLGLSSLWELHGLDRPELKDAPYFPTTPSPLKAGENVFQVLRRQDILLHHPYDSFSPVVDFVTAAANDPNVLAIKQTLYRVGPNPPIVKALIKARQNGKQVAALVELKARFDEESNIEWARALERAGVHVVYGLIGLKTHCKLSLVVRREKNGDLRRYVHASTGNYNAITARIYTDLGLMTSDEAFGIDSSDLFNYLTGYSKQDSFSEFLVAPKNLRQTLLELIESETTLGEKGSIILKTNSLVDAPIIRALYRASQAGVQIDLIVRGICCLRPGIPNVSENIRVISVVGRFLEHTRIYYFGNNGDPQLYVGSADLMPRNIDRRVEVLFPIRNNTLRQEVEERILKPYLRDTVKSHVLLSNGEYVSRQTCLPEDVPSFHTQAWFMKGRETAVPDWPLSLQKKAPVTNLSNKEDSADN